MKDNYQDLLNKIIDTDKMNGAYNIRLNGKAISKNITDNIDIITKKDGLDIVVKDNTNYEFIYLPVLITESGLTDIVYNDFYIGKNSHVYVIAGCAISHNSSKKSLHNGIHRFYLEENANLTYIETHYGDGNKKNSKLMNPITEIYMKKNSIMNMKTVQIKGIDRTKRITKAILDEGTKLDIVEKIMTNNNQIADTVFNIKLNGKDSKCHVISRSLAMDKSKQKFKSIIYGNNKCYAHVECDAIVKDNAKIVAIPEIVANNVDANLIHEASIGKIAGEQLIKLMTLGLTEKEAEAEIIKGFLR